MFLYYSELYSDKLAISVVNLNQIELATEEDRKYGIDRWAQLFKATTWEAIKQMAQENEYISSAAETMFESSQDDSMRFIMERVEEADRIRRGQEIRLERAETALKEAKETFRQELQARDEELQEKDNEIARLKALLAEKITPEEYTSIMQELGLFQELDKGLDDMEAGRELPLEKAFQKVQELRAQRN